MQLHRCTTMVTMSEDLNQEFNAEVGRYMVFATYGELMQLRRLAVSV